MRERENKKWLENSKERNITKEIDEIDERGINERGREMKERERKRE
jgi:hypothetical protein